MLSYRGYSHRNKDDAVALRKVTINDRQAQAQGNKLPRPLSFA